MTTDADLAATLYPSMAPQPAAPAQPASDPAVDLLRPVWEARGTATPPAPTTPAEPQTSEPKPSSDEQIASTLFDAGIQYRESLREGLSQLVEAHGLDTDTAAALHGAAANVFAQLEVPDGEARDWAGLVVKYAAGADEAQISEWTREASTRLREIYGPEAGARLAATQGLVRSFPGFAQMLVNTGLGSNPRVVLALVERAPKLLGKRR